MHVYGPEDGDIVLYSKPGATSEIPSIEIGVRTIEADSSMEYGIHLFSDDRGQTHLQSKLKSDPELQIKIAATLKEIEDNDRYSAAERLVAANFIKLTCEEPRNTEEQAPLLQEILLASQIIIETDAQLRMDTQRVFYEDHHVAIERSLKLKKGHTKNFESWNIIITSPESNTRMNYFTNEAGDIILRELAGTSGIEGAPVLAYATEQDIQKLNTMLMSIVLDKLPEYDCEQIDEYITNLQLAVLQLRNKGTYRSLITDTLLQAQEIFMRKFEQQEGIRSATTENSQAERIGKMVLKPHKLLTYFKVNPAYILVPDPLGKKIMYRYPGNTLITYTGIDALPVKLNTPDEEHIMLGAHVQGVIENPISNTSIACEVPYIADDFVRYVSDSDEVN
jgi:hypothetical protein